MRCERRGRGCAIVAAACYREAIAAAVCPNEAPSDASLAMAVTELRKALGETGDRPQFVRTVHRRGYAFGAGV